MIINKGQLKVLWIVVILLSIISALYGFSLLTNYGDDDNGIGIIFLFVIPILMIGAILFYLAGQKKSESSRS